VPTGVSSVRKQAGTPARQGVQLAFLDA
jgi:hypothetical protein